MTPRQPLNAVVGHSAIGPGVVASTGQGPALYASSNGADGNHAAIHADNTQASGGVAGYFTNNSNYSTVNLTNAGSGPVLYMVNGNNGSQVSGGFFLQAVNQPGSTLFEVRANGDVAQARAADGLAKAAARVYCAGDASSRLSYFNTLSAPVTVSTVTLTGACILDFGFQVSDRFVFLNSDSMQQVSCAQYTLPNTELLCNIRDLVGNPQPGNFTIIIF
jgi:hypothetical protein